MDKPEDNKTILPLAKNHGEKGGPQSKGQLQQ